MIGTMALKSMENGHRFRSEYRVEHYQQNPFDPSSYILVEEETKTALTDTEVTPEVKSYPGFQSPQAQNLWVTGDGGACKQYYYHRNSYPVTYVKNNGKPMGQQMSCMEQPFRRFRNTPDMHLPAGMKTQP